MSEVPSCSVAGTSPCQHPLPLAEDDAEAARAAHAGAAVGAEGKGGSPLAGAALKSASRVSAKRPALQGTWMAGPVPLSSRQQFSLLPENTMAESCLAVS